MIAGAAAPSHPNHSRPPLIGARHEAASAALANAVLYALILLLNGAIEIYRPGRLGHAGMRQGFAGGRQVIRTQRRARRIPGGCWDASIAAGLLGLNRKPDTRADEKHHD